LLQLLFPSGQIAFQASYLQGSISRLVSAMLGFHQQIVWPALSVECLLKLRLEGRQPPLNLPLAAI
jgi:hypothetical protein